MILGEIQIERFLQKTQGCLRGELTTDAKKWILRTPSMVAGLTDHIWTIEELLTTRISPLLLQQR